MNVKAILESQNYIVNLGNLWNQLIGYVSGSIQDRANEFNSLLKDNNILTSMIAGMNSSSILDVNYDLIKKNQAKIVGYSDTTAILLSFIKN